ncbi:sodium:proton exchanger [Desulfovibrio oxamicus]|uniref:Sodium:proton exchanger n=1 Tax=Nitratidesulfovibrio oxamicus TaxID=32016 RepID=A0ABS0J7H5_9BACT|nr:cation:proton antiporter [Nitratidesulfovibrio oxamicus]MBG3878346.1 sodium:proton exchanger [Nitratidesulfovibrio oxamicus]
MPHNIDLILTLAGGLTAALALGFITQKLRLSPIVGYLLAGMVVGPYSPGFVADADTATQFAELGVILLMFGVGLHFHLKDLMAVRSVAVPGAIVQIAAATVLGMLATHFFGWSWTSGAVFGIAISVASTVVLTRVLSDNRAMHTPVGHVAIGWLVVEDLFTILVLVLLPALFPPAAASGAPASVWVTLGTTTLKLGALVVFTLVAGQRVIPLLLSYVARTGTRDLFTLAVLVLALGIAVGAAEFFGASMALGAFLAGMVVGQSEFSARAAAEALPMRDAFAVLFFVSVGMLFDPASLATGWPLMLITLGIVLVGKPLAALLVVLMLGHPLRKAVSVAVALAQIGEFSFILASLGTALGVLPPEAGNAMVVAAVVSITLNPMLYKGIDPLMKALARRGIGVARPAAGDGPVPGPVDDAHRAVLIGYGPVGRAIARILRDNDMDVTVVEMNIDTVRELHEQAVRESAHLDALAQGPVHMTDAPDQADRADRADQADHADQAGTAGGDGAADSGAASGDDSGSFGGLADQGGHVEHPLRPLHAVHGDATQAEILRHAGLEEAEALIISTVTAPAREIIEVARAVNPNVRILIHTTYLREAEALRAGGAEVVFSGEGAVALSLSTFLLRELGATDEQVEAERRRIRHDFC